MSAFTLFGILISFISISYSTKYLRGTTYRKNNILINKTIVLVNKCLFIYLYYYIITNICNYIYNNDLLITYLGNKLTNNIYLLNEYLCIKLLSETFIYIYIIYYIQFYEYDGSQKLSLNSFTNRLFLKFFKLFGDYYLINDYKEYYHKDSDEIFMMGMHPHGLFPFGTVGCLGLPSNMDNIDDIFPLVNKKNLYIGTATFCFYIPGLREFSMYLGGVDCSKPILDRFLKEKNSIGLFMGGAEEAIHSGYGKTNLLIYKRKGFFKLAIENGATLIPVYTFGNNNTYQSYINDIFGILKIIKRIIGIRIPVGYPILRRHKFITVIGKPIKVEKMIDYNNYDIHILQEKYIDELTKIFNKYKYLDLSCYNKILNIIE